MFVPGVSAFPSNGDYLPMDTGGSVDIDAVLCDLWIPYSNDELGDYYCVTDKRKED